MPEMPPSRTPGPDELQRLSQALSGMDSLVEIITRLSLARAVDDVVEVIKGGARQLVGADGTTFILRDDGSCYYVDEDAIGPLWKGRRFPMEHCISGWAMIHGKAVAVPDVYADPRIPAEAYRPTFVKSLAIVPIRKKDPIGAIGFYWSTFHSATPEELRIMQALADSTSVALENVEVYRQLEERVQARTRELQQSNHDLEAFSYSVSHDLRAPLRAVKEFSEIIQADYAPRLDDPGRNYLRQVISASRKMEALIEDLLKLSRINLAYVSRHSFDLSRLCRRLGDEVGARFAGQPATFTVQEGMLVEANENLLAIAIENLLSNAWKYSSRKPETRVDVGKTVLGDGTEAYFVRDHGAGFSMAHAGSLFQPFRRLHAETEFPGVGIGLAIVRRVIEKHGGKVWAEAEPGKGATFYFTLPSPKREV